MAADLNAVIDVANFRNLVDVAAEQPSRINRDGRQIASENEGTFRRKEKHVSCFSTHGGILAVDAQPAIALHYGEELNLIRCRNSNASEYPSYSISREWGKTFRITLVLVVSGSIRNRSHRVTTLVKLPFSGRAIHRSTPLICSLA
jgi:hypothetical protein